MFGRKSHGDVKKSANKVLDQKKDTVTRLKHLRVVLETYDVEESKNFFEQHYSYIYYIFHDHFTTVEADLKQRASKQHREELDFVLYVLEKILTLLPDLIHKRWQYHSIGRIMKKLLHPGNSIKVQREGMRLFLIWYQVLMDNATEECHATYKSLVPLLGTGEGLAVDMFTVRSPSSSKIQPVEICPILPPLTGEEPQDNIARTLLKFLLKYMVEEVKKIQWSSSDMCIFSFSFLFNKFKEYYLKNIFPDFKDITIYEPCTEAARGVTLAMCQEAVVEWFTKMLSIKKPKSDNGQSEPQDKPSVDTVDHVIPMDGNADGLPGSNTSTLSMGSSEHDSTGSEHGSEEHSTAEHEIVCHVLYSSRENIDILHEAFLFPFQEGSSEAIRRVIHIYTDWFKITEEKDRPIFMQENTATDLHSPGLPRSESSPLIQNGGNSLNLYSKSQPHLPEAVSVGNHICKVTSLGPEQNVKAGLQRVIQLFVTNTANVFLLDLVPVPGRDSEHGVELMAQVGICKKVINAYRFVIQNHFMEQQTWNQMLLVLLKITSGVLKQNRPCHKENTLGGRLAHPLLQTLIVTWIKANIHVHVSNQLWDHFFAVLSSLTGCVQLVQEWAKHMETLTRVLARHIYDLDLNDLPLDRLSEQKTKRRRGRQPHNNEDHKRTFTRGLSRNDPVDILKAQMRSRDDQNSPRSGCQSLIVSESAPIVRSPQVGVSKDDGFAHMNRPRTLSGDASPISLSQTHLIGDALPAPGAMIRSNSDSSLMVDLEKTGSSDLLSEEGGDRRSLTEHVLSHIVLNNVVKCLRMVLLFGNTIQICVVAVIYQGTEEICCSILCREVEKKELVSFLHSDPGTYYSAPEDVEDDEEQDDETFEKILSDIDLNEQTEARGGDAVVASEKNTNSHQPEHASPGSAVSGHDRMMPVAATATADRPKGICHRTSEENNQNVHASFYLADAMTDKETDDDTEVDDSMEKHSEPSQGGLTPRNVSPDLPETKGLSNSITDNGDGVSLTSNPPVDTVSMASGDSSVQYQIIDTTDSNSVSFDRSSLRSDTESLLKYQNSSRNSSVGCHISVPSSEPSIPSDGTLPDDSEGTLADNEDEEAEQHGSQRGGQRSKDSPTPDRESIHIEDMNTLPGNGVGSKQLSATVEDDNRSVVAGGTLPGWTPVSSVVIWRRMLGCLGDINTITEPQIHEQVFEYLCDLVDLMLKMRVNQSVTKDNQSSPPPPQFIPPILYFSGWIFELTVIGITLASFDRMWFCNKFVWLPYDVLKMPIDSPAYRLSSYTGVHFTIVIQSSTDNTVTGFSNKMFSDRHNLVCILKVTNMCL
ncbi:hypothetical protein LSH36_118g02001 [Paralvinella palmiformis]|uniref:Ral GTPase-activating protein subunit alpha/beta N-terminal domain-containing protein n=1 Tax=Paralvinella palmiformis TaxID=53620 RepID=A0AAD9JY40_9ANNE|nr:hypothetical protein LSH36_118g02001 [Paralvinella palmiformis]